ncbi:MAG: nucleoside triphosphate pyrophosphohydrolase [Calditrichaeota bacterium]|nr:MAG: nucleoside triphosphate pyrophosphohydrolase [Calditrichota bacterium]
MPEKAFAQLVHIMKRLRRECPWDREQTPQSLRQYILEEAFETVEAIDNEDWQELKKELGDLLLQVVFQAEIAEETGQFSLAEVIQHINQKLIQRHPHVFGKVKAETAQQVKENWEEIKFRTEKRRSYLDGIPRQMCALLRAQRVQEKAAKVGFDWPDASGVLEKIEEEIQELKASLKSGAPEAMEEELGDLLFSLVNLSRFYDINAEDALRKTTNKFMARFQYIEQKLAEQKRSVQEATLEEMDRLWEEAKRNS